MPRRRRSPSRCSGSRPCRPRTLAGAGLSAPLVPARARRCRSSPRPTRCPNRRARSWCRRCSGNGLDAGQADDLDRRRAEGTADTVRAELARAVVAPGPDRAVVEGGQTGADGHGRVGPGQAGHLRRVEVVRRTAAAELTLVVQTPRPDVTGGVERVGVGRRAGHRGDCRRRPSVIRTGMLQLPSRRRSAGSGRTAGPARSGPQAQTLPSLLTARPSPSMAFRSRRNGGMATGVLVSAIVPSPAHRPVHTQALAVLAPAPTATLVRK